MVRFNCLSPFVLLHDLCTERRYPHAVSLCPLEHLEQVKQVFCESPVSKVRISLSSLVLIHPSEPWPLPGHPEAMKMEPSPYKLTSALHGATRELDSQV
jgi:hypothetical protein